MLSIKKHEVTVVVNSVFGLISSQMLCFYECSFWSFKFRHGDLMQKNFSFTIFFFFFKSTIELFNVNIQNFI